MRGNIATINAVDVEKGLDCCRHWLCIVPDSKTRTTLSTNVTALLISPTKHAIHENFATGLLSLYLNPFSPYCMWNSLLEKMRDYDHGSCGAKTIKATKHHEQGRCWNSTTVIALTFSLIICGCITTFSVSVGYTITAQSYSRRSP